MLQSNDYVVSLSAILCFFEIYWRETPSKAVLGIMRCIYFCTRFEK